MSTDRQDLDAQISVVTWPGCCRAAVDSDGHTHDHAEWFAEVQRLRARLAEVEAERDEARAELADVRGELTAVTRNWHDVQDALERAMPVVEAATEVRRVLGRASEPGLHAWEAASQTLVAVVDTYTATQEETDGR